jgi:type IV pilus assembly protein PilA
METPTAMKSLKEQLRDEGFTLIELLIVMSIMLILITLAVPQYRKVRKQTNETSAVASLKAIGAAQVQFNQAYPQSGYSCTLGALGGDPSAGAPSVTAAQVLDPGLSGGSKAGYIFSISNCTKVPVNNQDMITRYEVTAVPITVGGTGDRGYCMDENNLIKFDPAGGTNCTQSLQ